ncbi:MAG TPA: hypothetical protein DCK76_12065 [Desulfotomaculum sp.]|nr:hypothetical protein [Desulfotomaculum sp.]HBY02955.1 hypothetical protein [Desulfotomaculum sp.]
MRSGRAPERFLFWCWRIPHTSYGVKDSFPDILPSCSY